jgi:uncharacterized protein with HEPN domain
MKNHRVLLEHILESILLIEKYTAGLEEKGFLEDLLIQDSVYRRLEIIGEAVKNLPGDYRKQHSEVPWKRIAGLRDVLIHQYFSVDAELTWSLLQEDLPALKRQIQRLLQSD